MISVLGTQILRQTDYRANRIAMSKRKEIILHVTSQDGAKHKLIALDGWRAMEVIRDYGLPIKAECGGACSCATCHVYVADNWADRLIEPTTEEEGMLDEAFEVQENSRLSCQILMSEELNGLQLTLAPGSEPD
jgi:2Fe-2S ferredoxin